MGIAYLGYDLAAFFVPATLSALCWRRRMGSALASAALQLMPSAIWIFLLKYLFGQSLENSNTAIYHSVLLPYLHPSGLIHALKDAVRLPAIGGDIFFAANFIFLPALFIVVIVVNPLTSRIRFHVAEAALLLTGLALFILLNLAPSHYSGWEMSGTWISRIYQPLFPALLLFAARWWQGLPALTLPCRAALTGALGATTLGNALIVFGPILKNPGRVSETAFYRFYDHTDAHFVYEANLENLGRRPLGFPRRMFAPSAGPDVRLAEQRERDEMIHAVEANRTALIQNQRAYRDTGRALALAQSDVYAARLALRRIRGEITAEEERHLSKTWRDFVSEPVRALLDDPLLDGAIVAPTSRLPDQSRQALRNAIDSESVEIVLVQGAILAAQKDLKKAISELDQAHAELTSAHGAAPRT